MRWHCPPDTGFEIRALAIWGRVRYLSEAPYNIESLWVSGEEKHCLFKTSRPERGSNPWSATFPAGSFNHCTRAPALMPETLKNVGLTLCQRRRRWTSVKPTLIQHLVSAGAFSIRWIWEIITLMPETFKNVGLTLGQRRRRWTSVKPTLIQHLVSAGAFSIRWIWEIITL